jgi:hypothetical protein
MLKANTKTTSLKIITPHHGFKPKANMKTTAHFKLDKSGEPLPPIANMFPNGHHRVH